MLVIVALFLAAMAGSAYCQPTAENTIHIPLTKPVDPVDREKAILERYKNITDRFPTVSQPDTHPATSVLTPATVITGMPTASITTLATQPQADSRPNATGPGDQDARGAVAKSAVFSAIITLALGGGSLLLHLGLLLRDLHGTPGPSPWWQSRRRAFSGAHAMIAALLLIQAIAFLGSFIAMAGMPGRDIAWGIAAGFFLFYGAVSSAGLAYASALGRVVKRTSLLHLAAGACGAAAFMLLPVITPLPFASFIPSLTFLASISIVVIQARPLSSTAGEPGETYTDTMLFEERADPFVPQFPPELARRYYEPRFLHQGGIARVFSARRREDGVMVAVKIPIQTDEQTGRSLLREMGVWRTLVHPGIVQVYAANILPIPYVEMEYLPGNLSEIPLPLGPCDAAWIVMNVAIALEFAHERGVIHRDLKPGNILLTDTGMPKIGDWGLSRNDMAPAETTLHGFSLSYAAPEQLDPARFGRTTNRTDIYQLGVIFYQLVTGVLPFPGESIADITRERLDGNVRPPSARVPSAGVFDAIIQRCLAVRPEDRYRTMRDLITDLDAIVEDLCGSFGAPEGSLL